MNFSCPDSKFWLDDRKVLGFCGVLYSETFKALWEGRSDPSRIRDLFSKASMLGRYGIIIKICFIKVLLIIDFFFTR